MAVKGQARAAPLTVCVTLGKLLSLLEAHFLDCKQDIVRFLYLVGRVGQGDGDEVLGKPSLNSGPPMTFPHLSELSGWETQGPPGSCLLPPRHLMP